MNTLGLRCTVSSGRGTVIGIISLENGVMHRFMYKSPSIFSFSRNSGEILNWHRENIISLITQFDIEAIAIKKSENDSFSSRLRKSDIFKLYLEGVLLSLAGSVGIANHHFYKNDIKLALEDNIFEQNIDAICSKFSKEFDLSQVLAAEINATKEALLSVLTLEKLYNS